MFHKNEKHTGNMDKYIADMFYYRYYYGNGDYYQGHVYGAPSSYKYYPGLKISKKNELGLNGYYQIVSQGYTGDTAKYGQVYVDTYKDGESGKTFTPVHKGQAVGTNYLGSELDYILKNGVAVYQFGKGYYEADVGDKYAFRYYYGNGDSYQGSVYRAPSASGYYPGLKITKKNELGLNGYYEILSMSWTGDTAKYGQVYVDNYKDGESAKSFTPVHKGQAVGTNYLGSELDYIVKDGVAAYQFGKGWYEADVGDRYVFRYSYDKDNPLAEYYQGVVYRSPGVVYYPGYTSDKKNETGKTGSYQILSMSYTGDTAKYGQVYVDYYKDGESTKGFTPVHKGQAVGTNYLGSEMDYILKDGVAAYKFGQGYYEADVGDKYAFRYYYGNGDYYQGYVYRAPSASGYYPGLKITKKNELGLNGYYQILSQTWTGDTAKYGKVYVDWYNDADRTTAKWFRPLNYTSPLGSSYLTSEVGYIVSVSDAHKFGQGYWEADE